MYPLEPLLSASSVLAAARRRTPFETILGVITIPSPYVPPTVQSETDLESLYFEPLYIETTPYSESVYGESKYQQLQFYGVEPTVE